jgi:hypothetical protein
MRNIMSICNISAEFFDRVRILAKKPFPT